MYNVYYYGERAELQYKHVLLKRSNGVEYEERQEPQQYGERLDNSLSRTRRLFFDYAMCNQFDLFVTFTFNGDKIDRYDFDVVGKSLRKFFNNYKYRYDTNFRYLLIPEYHEDKAIHFHGFMTMPVDACVSDFIPKRNDRGELEYVPNTPGYISWPSFAAKLGYFSASVIQTYEKAVTYCTSYITKSFSDMRFKGRQLLFKSNGMKKPEKVYSSYDGSMSVPAEFENDFCKVAWVTRDETPVKCMYWADQVQYLPTIEDDSLFLPLFEQVKIQEYLKERGTR